MGKVLSDSYRFCFDMVAKVIKELEWPGIISLCRIFLIKITEIDLTGAGQA